MTIKARVVGAAAMIGAVLAMNATAQAQVVVTSVTASFPDSAQKVPALNAVPGAAIPTFSDGLAQGVLTHGQFYSYCVSLASATATGKATVSYRISRGATTIQAATIIPSSKFSVSSNGIWYWCSGYKALPNSPGAANLSGTVAFIATGATKPVVSHTTAAILLQ